MSDGPLNAEPVQDNEWKPSTNPMVDGQSEGDTVCGQATSLGQDQVELAPEDVAVLEELEKLQTQKSGWVGAILVLVVSLMLFIGVAQAQSAWEGIIVILIPVLAFHEFGHYVAMRYFGYRNVRMFFIPLLGAAVSGRHYNVAGWKKAVVALAGPLPGILVGVPLGMIGLFLGVPKIVDVALLMLILNGFNLLPFPPLDGGWIVHAVLFVRHPVLDGVFRLLAALAMLGLGVLLGEWILAGLGVFMLIGVPFAWRMAGIAHRLRDRGTPALSTDGQSIPSTVALPILAEVRRASPANSSPKIIAMNVVNVFEALNSHPPNVLASLGLLAIHASAFLVAFVTSVVLIVFRHGLA